MKKVLFIAIMAMCMVGCCKKADNKCCEGEKAECVEQAAEAEAPAAEEAPAEAPAEEAAPAEAPAEEAAPAPAE